MNETKRIFSSQETISCDAPNLECLNELEEILRLQMSLVQNGDLTAVEQMMPQMAEKLKEAGSHSTPGIFDPNQAQRVRKLYESLLLALAARKDELSGRIRQMSQGKSVRRLYSGM